MSIKKFQHYVPKFYLKSFSFDFKTPYPIYCFDKKSEKNFKSSTDNVCREPFFYDTAGDYVKSVENTLNKLESKFSSSYRKIIRESNIKSLDKSDKTLIAAFFLTQWYRTKEMREKFRGYNRQMSLFLSKKGELSKNLRTQLDTKDNYIKDIHIPLLKEIPKHIPYVLNMKWTLLLNKTDMPFWTSDNPIAFDNIINPSKFDSYGLFSKGINVHFPLSPELSLCFSNPSTSFFFPDKLELKDVNNIIYQNKLQIKSSYRTIISNKNDFNLAKEIIKSYPSLKDLNRKRWNVQSLKSSYYKEN
jgi:hypothetical protein